MKLFNRGGNQDAKSEGAAPATATMPQGAQPQPPVAAAPSAASTTAAAATAAPGAEAARDAGQPDLTSILDANVKEMSEKIAKLTTSLEGSETEKATFEAKIEQMEDRMRKLSALTEMISAQYNPFVGDAPHEREALPTPEVGLAAPPMPAEAAPQEAPAEQHLAPPLQFAAAAEEEMEEVPDLAALPGFAPESYAPEPRYTEPPMAPLPDDEPTHGAHVWTIRPSFESSLLMLGWADMLLKNVPSRDSLADLVNYYHNIGWIGDPARDMLLAYADGITSPDADGAHPDWRASVDIHEKSLLFLEKLKALSHGAR